MYDYMIILTQACFVNRISTMASKDHKQPVLTDEALRLVSGRFRALSDPTRLRILNTLMQGENSVQELVETTGLEQSNVSRHLSVLRREGIVERRAEGNRAVYSINDPTIVQLCEIVCGGLEGVLAGELESLPDPKVWSGDGI
jgi:DNA-binding transcriptional ArsR family regulator